MKRLLAPAAGALLLVLLLALAANGQSPFDQPLAPDQKLLHALNRLAFGPRPGDLDEVRRIGLEKWIALQLHPERITESPALEARLQPLETLRMETAAVMRDYAQPAFRPALIMQITDVLPADQLRRLSTGTNEERMALLQNLDPAKREMVLVRMPQVAACSPELQKETEAARKAEQETRQKEIRKLNPQLNDLLTPEQVRVARQGDREQLAKLFADLDPAKRAQVAGALPPQTLAAFPELRREGMRKRQPQQVLMGDLREGKIFRAVYSNRQLEEVLVDFWFNHFNVFEGKQSVRPLLAGYERDAIRPHVFGKFKDLLLATAHHPAMLYYLDNWESMSPDVFSVGPFAEPVESVVRQASRRAHGINENYGRELMELHTMGVKGGYTQEDVIAVARCFTGWTIRQPNTQPEFVFAPFMHDSGEKTVLGHKIAAGGGEQDGLEVIDILAHHPSTAKFISRELAKRFVADDPPESLVDRMAQTFTKSDGDLRAVMETMFASREFFSQGAWQAKIKSPFEMVVSALRAVNADATDVFTAAQRIADLGEPLYGKLEPTGYPNTGELWLSTASVFGRINFGAALASSQIAGIKVDSARLEGQDAAAIGRELLGSEPSKATLEGMSSASSPKNEVALALGSPDFQKR
jgi:uncharacterized protein (DUF1800 family)